VAAQISSVRRVILLGGGMLYAKLLSFCKGNGFETLAITAKRHLLAPAEGQRTLREFLAREGIRCHALKALDERRLKEIVGGMEHSLAITLGAPWEIGSGLIERVFAGKIFNCHGTRLPTYRGGAMYSWNILRGNRLGLCLLQRLNETDTGEIVRWEEFVYPASCRVPLDYEAHYVERNAAFLSDFLLRARRGPVAYSPVGQPEYLSSFFPRLSSRVNGWINWDWALEDVERFICAFDEPYPGARTTHNGRTVRLKGVVAQRNDGRGHPCQAGLVYRNNGRWLMVSCGDGELIVHRVLDQGNRNVIGRIKAGERFVTPVSRLESAKGGAHFTPEGESLTGRSDPLARFAAGPRRQAHQEA
jgi:methionyl-tRNA formyltransferase